MLGSLAVVSPTGERQSATYTVGTDLKQWSYNNYAAFGPLSKGSVSRVPQTITQLDGSGNFTPEEFHYLYL